MPGILGAGPVWPGAVNRKKGAAKILVILLLLAFGSAILSFLISWQVRHIVPDFWPVARYNLVVLPLIFVANTAMGLAFVRAHGTVKNLPLLVAGQSFIYYIFVVAFLVLLVGDKITVGRAVAGFALIAAGVYLLKA